MCNQCPGPSSQVSERLVKIEPELPADVCNMAFFLIKLSPGKLVAALKKRRTRWKTWEMMCACILYAICSNVISVVSQRRLPNEFPYCSAQQ